MFGRMLNKLTSEWKIRRDPISYARSLGVEVGERCRFLGITTGTFGSEPYLIRIGNHVTITAGVQFITHDGGVWVFREQEPDIDVIAPIVVGDNVFVGTRAIIMPSVIIGSNSVIGAGSIVTRDVSSGTVVAGVPARTIQSIEDYKKKVLSKAIYIRSLSSANKREYLERKFPK